MLRSVRQIADLIRPTITERVYAYGDGNTSNLLITHDGSVVLVDWDWAGVMEPAQDLGVTLVELGSTEREARSLFKLATGGSDETVFAKAMLYGYSDMVRQGLIGAITDRLEPGTLEYSKYGDWQFLRARFSLQSYRTSDFMRRLES